MIKLPLILPSEEELKPFFALFPRDALGNASNFLQNHIDLFIDDSAKVIRGSLVSSVALSHMGLFFDGEGLFLVDTDKSLMTVDLSLTFHGIVLGKGSDPLVKAASIKGQKSQETVVFDFSAGTLRDTLHLLKAGFKVVAFERHLVVFLLLNAALKKSPFEKELQLIFGDPSGMEFAENFPDVIYFDPMFEGTMEKSAKPRKEMLLFHKLFLENYSFLGQFKKNKSDNEVLEFALKHAVKKVIVKRSPKALSLKKPTFDYLSKTVRFDVYDVSFKKE